MLTLSAQTPSSLLGAVFQCLQGKAYTIGLIFTLNARVTFKAEMNKDEEVGLKRRAVVISLLTEQGRAGQVYGMSKVSRPAQTQIEVHVEETTWVDVSYAPFRPLNLAKRCRVKRYRTSTRLPSPRPI